MSTKLYPTRFQGYLKFLAVCCSSSLFLGCASTDDNLKEPPSRAMQIASTSYLTRDNQVLWNTVESPLKDYSFEDIEHLERSYKSKPGNASLLFGTLSVLTGNFTGAIDITGGAAANIAKSTHVAKHSSWVVRVPIDAANNGLEARQYAIDKIRTAGLELLEESGITPTKIIVKEQRKATFGATLYPETAYRVGSDEKADFFYEYEYYRHNEEYGLVLDQSILIEGKPTYTNTYETKLSGVHPFNLYYFEKYNITPYDQRDGFEIFMKALTLKVPSEYFYYDAPSSFNNYVPTIYQAGEKYQFIKPSDALRIQQKLETLP